MSTTLSVDVEPIGIEPNQLGETPLWCDRENKLWWVDIERPKIQSFSPDTGKVESHPRDCTFLGSHALTQSGHHLFAQDLNLVLAADTHDAGEKLTQVEQGLDNRLNDGRVDARGRLWIGTMDNQLHRPNGALYRVDPNGKFERIMQDVIVSNGIAFSPNGETLYFTDTRRHLSYALTLDIDDGVVTDTRIFADYSASGDRPDGACVDVDGCVWAAFFGGGRVVRYAPDGNIDLVIPLPVTNPTCLCFGGKDFKTLYVTTATKFLTEDQKANEPLAGLLLAIDGVGQGVAEHRFAA